MGSAQPSEKQKQHLTNVADLIAETACDLRDGAFPVNGEGLYPEDKAILAKANPGIFDGLNNTFNKVEEAVENSSIFDTSTCAQLATDVNKFNDEISKVDGIHGLSLEMHNFTSLFNVFETAVKYATSVRE